MTVHLVGAGPGDPELLTVRAVSLLRRADAVVYDRLVDPAVLDLAPPWAELIGVGKTPGAPSPSQASINAVLIDRGRRFSCVVRLKGGDPFVFGRGGEEATALGAAGIDVEVVPGVTSAVAAPAAAGIPVTMRGVASGFTVVTAHQDPSSGRVARLGLAARAGTTLVILMGAARPNRLPTGCEPAGWQTTRPCGDQRGHNLDAAHRTHQPGGTAPASGAQPGHHRRGGGRGHRRARPPRTKAP